MSLHRRAAPGDGECRGRRTGRSASHAGRSADMPADRPDFSARSPDAAPGRYGPRFRSGRRGAVRPLRAAGARMADRPPAPTERLPMLSFFVLLQNFLTRPLRRDDRGASAVEYGLLVFLIAIAIVVAVTALGSKLASIFSTVTTDL